MILHKNAEEIHVKKHQQQFRGLAEITRFDIFVQIIWMFKDFVKYLGIIV